MLSKLTNLLILRAKGEKINFKAMNFWNGRRLM